MGLDVSIHLIVGVPLSKLGELVIDETQVKLTNVFGQLTGKKAILRTGTFVALNGTRYEVLSNRRDLLKGMFHTSLSLSLEPLGMDDHIHISDYESNEIGDVVIGTELHCEKGSPKYDRFEKYTMTKTDNQEVVSNTKEFLKKEFGYDGDLYYIALCRYGY